MTIPINDGDDFKNWFVKEVKKKYNFGLETKLRNLDAGPELDFDETKNMLLLKQHGISYEINLPKIGTDLLHEGLACLYGYGICKYNYEITGFQDLPEAELDEYKRLALELWDRNIHIDWMKSNGYETHNETKDLMFCKRLASKDKKVREFGVSTHREQSKIRLHDDTDHHSLKYTEFLNEISRGNKHGMLTEVMLDQASIAGRWYKKRLNYTSLHCDAQTKHKEKGIYFHDINSGWIPDLVDPDLSYLEHETWDEWSEINNSFSKFWNDLFQNNNSFWSPPVAKDELDKIG